MAKILVVTAVAAECDAINAVVPDSVHVVAGGVGPANSAASTARLIALDEFDLVLSAGIGGGFTTAAVGSVVVASSIVFADLGAETQDGFLSVSELGFDDHRYEVDPAVATALVQRTGAKLGSILTVATVTGSDAGAARLMAAYPDAVAEAMEGAGVAAAAHQAGLRFGEVRAISNVVGPRDRSAWRIPEALGALAHAFAAIGNGAGWGR